MRIFIVLCTVVAFALAESCTDDELKQYKKWQREFNRPIYKREKELKRCAHFKNALLHIKKHNADSSKHKVALNGLSDLSPEEFAQRLGGRAPDNYVHEVGTQKSKRSPGSYPESRDWRDHNMVTHVKDQSDCKSCWAFAVTGSIEAANAKKNEELISLSEQDLVDCTPDADCAGGWQFDAYKDVIKRGGIATENSYPYVSGKTSTANAACSFDNKTVGAKIKDYVNIATYDPGKVLVRLIL